MNRISFKHLAIATLAALTIGCASSSSSLKSKEDVAIAADFKVITPIKPEQLTAFKKLPAGKFAKINYAGKSYYLLKDTSRQQVYVGGPKQYQTYQQLSQAKQYATENAQDQQTLNQNNSNTIPEGGTSAYYAGVDENIGLYDNAFWGGWQGWGGWNGENDNADERAANGWY